MLAKLHANISVRRFMGEEVLFKVLMSRCGDQNAGFLGYHASLFRIGKVEELQGGRRGFGRNNEIDIFGERIGPVCQ